MSNRRKLKSTKSRKEYKITKLKLALYCIHCPPNRGCNYAKKRHPEKSWKLTKKKRQWNLD